MPGAAVQPQGGSALGFEPAREIAGNPAVFWDGRLPSHGELLHALGPRRGRLLEPAPACARDGALCLGPAPPPPRPLKSRPRRAEPPLPRIIYTAAGAQTDIWSLGCVLYELAALRTPFDAPSLRGLISKARGGAAAGAPAPAPRWRARPRPPPRSAGPGAPWLRAAGGAGASRPRVRFRFRRKPFFGRRGWKAHRTHVTSAPLPESPCPARPKTLNPFPLAARSSAARTRRCRRGSAPSCAPWWPPCWRWTRASAPP
jgi:hypothetical protein